MTDTKSPAESSMGADQRAEQMLARIVAALNLALAPTDPRIPALVESHKRDHDNYRAQAEHLFRELHALRVATMIDTADLATITPDRLRQLIQDLTAERERAERQAAAGRMLAQFACTPVGAEVSPWLASLRSLAEKVDVQPVPEDQRAQLAIAETARLKLSAALTRLGATLTGNGFSFPALATAFSKLGERAETAEAELAAARERIARDEGHWRAAAKELNLTNAEPRIVLAALRGLTATSNCATSQLNDATRLIAEFREASMINAPDPRAITPDRLRVWIQDLMDQRDQAHRNTAAYRAANAEAGIALAKHAIEHGILDTPHHASAALAQVSRILSAAMESEHSKGLAQSLSDDVQRAVESRDREWIAALEDCNKSNSPSEDEPRADDPRHIAATAIAAVITDRDATWAAAWQAPGAEPADLAAWATTVDEVLAAESGRRLRAIRSLVNAARARLRRFLPKKI